MPSNICTPFYMTGDVSFKASAAVTGKRFVAPSGNRTGGPGMSTDLANTYVAAHCPANGKASGVAKYDVAQGDYGPQFGTPGTILPVTADGAIAAGDLIVVGSAGKAKAATVASGVVTGGIVVGLAMTGAADGTDAQIKLV